MNKTSLNNLLLNTIFLNGAKAVAKSGGGGVKVEWEEVTLYNSNNSILIQNIKPNSITSFEVFGGATNYNPSPTHHNSIITNLGTIAFVNDGLPVGAYARLQGITFGADTYYVIDGFRLKGSDTLRVSFTANKACNLIGCYTTADAEDNYDIYLSTTANSKYLRYNGGAYLSTVVVGERYDVVVTPTGCTSFGKKSTWEQKDFTASVDMVVGTTSVSATSSSFDGTIHGDVIVDGRLHLVPCERLSDGVIGYYDTIGRKFYEPTVGAGVAGEYDGSKVSQADYNMRDYFEIKDADSDELYSTIDVPMVLLGIGEDKDSWDMISGNVVRKIGYYVFTGDESFSTSTTYGSALLLTAASTKWGADRNKSVKCSYFIGQPMVSSGSMSNNTCFFNASGHFYFRTSKSADIFSLWLKQRYAAGVPCVVAYALSSESVEVAQVVHPYYRGEDVEVVREDYNRDNPFKLTCKVKMGAAIVFHIEGQEFSAKVRMTWAEWCDDPELNPAGYYINDYGWVELYEGSGWLGTYYSVSDGSGSVLGTDVIEPNFNYILMVGGIG